MVNIEVYWQSFFPLIKTSTGQLCNWLRKRKFWGRLILRIFQNMTHYEDWVPREQLCRTLGLFRGLRYRCRKDSTTNTIAFLSSRLSLDYLIKDFLLRVCQVPLSYPSVHHLSTFAPKSKIKARPKIEDKSLSLHYMLSSCIPALHRSSWEAILLSNH